MKRENWIKNVNGVTRWLEQDDRGEQGQAIQLSIMLGNNTDDEALMSTYWTAIRSIGSVFDDFPKARKGRESSLPSEVHNNVLSVRSLVHNAFVTMSNPEVILNVILPHGRTGGAYADMDALANYFADKAETALTTGYKSGRWDGTLVENNPQMVAPPVKGEEAQEEE